jgi:membrane-associated protease RseP (regulator of RpoE activity)
VKDPLEEAGVDVTTRAAKATALMVLLGLVVLVVAKPSARYTMAIIFGIVAMVVLHEAGHYLVAKRAGMKVTEFFVGFGPRLWSFRRGETEYGVKAILLGGYVRVIGMTNLEEVDPADEPRTFRRASYKDRFLLTIAGVTVNFLLALLLFFVVIAGQGLASAKPITTVSAVVAKSAAANAGFRDHDRIIAVDGQPTPDWNALKRAIESHGGIRTTFVVLRHGQPVTLIATPARQHDKGFLGIAPNQPVHYRHVGILGAVPAVRSAKDRNDSGTGRAFAHLVSPAGVQQYSKNFTSNAPASPTSNQTRPVSIIGIVDQGSNLVNGNPWALLWLLGGISLILALFNLLPVLPFDGGHAVVVLYEWVASRIRHREVRVDFRKLMPVTAVVLVALLTLSLSAAFLDVRQAFGS